MAVVPAAAGRRSASGRSLTYKVLERVGLGGGLVGAPAQDAREAHGDAALVGGSSAWIASNASSNTSTGSTRRTGPKRSSVCARTHASTLRISSSVRPEYALANGTSSSSRQTRERVVGVERRAPAVPGLRVDEHRVDRVRLDLPLPPVARARGPRRTASRGASASGPRRAARALARAPPRARPSRRAHQRRRRGASRRASTAAASSSAARRSSSGRSRTSDAVELEQVVASSTTGVSRSSFGPGSCGRSASAARANGSGASPSPARRGSRRRARCRAAARCAAATSSGKRVRRRAPRRATRRTSRRRGGRPARGCRPTSTRPASRRRRRACAGSPSSG